MSAKPPAARPAPPDEYFLDGDSLLRIFALAGLRAETASQPRSGVAAVCTGAQQQSAAIAVAKAPGKAAGDGALRIEVGTDAPAAVALGDGTGLRLGDLDALSFDYYLGDGARAAPTVRLLVDADGDLSTTHDRIQLVFEHVRAGEGVIGTGGWHSADLAGGDWLGWQYSDGVNLDGGASTVGLARWDSAAGFAPQGGYRVDANSLVLDCFLVVAVEEKPAVVFVDNLQLGPIASDFAI